MSRDEIIKEIPKWRKLIYGIVLEAGFVADDAEDLTADIVLKAMEKAGEFDSTRGKLQTWIGSMAKWTAVERRRTNRGRWKKRPEMVDLVDIVAVAPVAHDMAENHETIAAFVEAARTPSERRVAELYVLDADAPTVATSLGVGRSYVYQVVAECRKRCA